MAMVGRRRPGIWRRGATLAALVLVGRTLAAGAAPSRTSEYEIKAAYLYYFATYIEWPESALARAGDSLVVGILGDDPFGPLLDAIVRDKAIGPNHLVVRRFARVRDALKSHVLFISSSEQDRLPEILKIVGEAGILTVGDSEGFTTRGGVIGLRTEERKVRFDINVAAADRAGLRISAQLLKLGTITNGRPAPGG